MSRYVFGLGVSLTLGLVSAAAALGAQASPEPGRIAMARAEQLGTIEGQPATVQTTLGDAEEKTTGVVQAKNGPLAAPAGAYERPVELLTFNGLFSGTAAEPTPPGQTLPDARKFEVVVETETGQIRGETLSDWYVPKANAARRRARATLASRSHSRARKATWDGVCNWKEELPEYVHCYNLQEWVMTGAETKVRGAEMQNETTNMTVPLGNEGRSFVTNEEWAQFPDKKVVLEEGRPPVNYWVENGIIAGGGYGETELRWFFAWTNASRFHKQLGWPEEGWRFVNFSMQSSQNENEWCFHVDGSFAGCANGLENYARVLQVGSEFYVPWLPVDDLNEQTNYTTVKGKIRSWNEVTGAQRCSPDCFSTPFSREAPPHYYPGNDSFWIPSWGKNS